MVGGLRCILGVGVLKVKYLTQKPEVPDHECLENKKIQRRNLMPAFQYRHVKDLYAIFWSQSRDMFEAVTKIGNEKEPAQYVDDGPVVEMDSWINHATHDIIGLAGMGQDFNSLPDRNTKLNRTYQNIFRSQSAPSALLLVISPI